MITLPSVPRCALSFWLPLWRVGIPPHLLLFLTRELLRRVLLPLRRSLLRLLLLLFLQLAPSPPPPCAADAVANEYEPLECRQGCCSCRLMDTAR